MTFAKFVLRSFIDLAALLFAGIVFIRRQVVPCQTDHLVSLMLGIPALMAISSLWGRNRRLAKIESPAHQNYDLVLKEFGERAKARNFFRE